MKKAKRKIYIPPEVDPVEYLGDIGEDGINDPPRLTHVFRMFSDGVLEINCCGHGEFTAAEYEITVITPRGSKIEFKKA